MRRQLILVAIGLFVVLFVCGPSIKGAFAAMGNSDAQQAAPAQPPGHLTGPNAGDAAEIALAYLRQNTSALGLTPADLGDIVVKDRYLTQHNGVTHLYIRQRYKGIEVDNGDINISIAADGAVISLGNRFVANLASKVNADEPVYSAASAIEQAAAYLKLPIAQPLQVVETTGGPSQAVTLSGDGLSKEPIPAELFYVRQPGDRVRLVWKALIHQPDNIHVWNVGVDAVTGALIQKVDTILREQVTAESASAPLQAEPALPGESDPALDAATQAQQPPSPLAPPSYRVFAQPLEHPNDGPGLPASQTLVRNPADPVASPFGWHDIDGLPGHDFLDTRGNNVSAQEDRNGDDVEGFRPTGRQPRRFNFDYRFNPQQEPGDTPNLSVSIVNLFYWANTLHDLAYQYGFDEASGNFQTNNYDRGGLGADALHADAQDGYDLGARNNSFFTPTPDGVSPLMGMFVFDLTTPNRDSALDNGIIIHEYAHGISTRLVGGPSNPYCLYNAEQMGEGWSDWFTLALTAKANDVGTRPWGIGTYVLGQANDGPGIRPYLYTTDMTINPLTYASIRQNSNIYHVGQVWATMLWDLHWVLVEQYGFDPNLQSGTGGNNQALRLVIDGMKFTPCEPGFVDVRNAILTADLVDNGGANQCLIWQAFARRGLGFSADQGSPFDTFDGHEAFDLPPLCRDDLGLTKNGSPPIAEAGQPLSYTLVATNYTSRTLTGLTLNDPLPADVTYLPGSASEGGTEAGGVITWPLPDLNPDEALTRTFSVTVNRNYPDPVEVFFDNMENGTENWIADGLWHWQDDAEACGNSFSPTHSWYFGETPSCFYTDNSTGQLTTAAPISLPLGKVTLTFQSWESAENCCDQRIAQVSTDGTTFTTVWFSTNSRAAWYEASVDLSPYSGKAIWLRFEFVADPSIALTGWYVDDVRVAVAPSIHNVATLTSNEGLSAVADSTNEVIKLPHIAAAPAALEETLKLGNKVERTLTISNVGAAPLDFAVVIQAAELATPTLRATVGTPPQVEVPANGTVSEPARSYTGDRIQARAGFHYEPKLRGLTSEAGPNVLLLASADVFQLQAILDAYPDLGLVDIFDARTGTPTLDQLLGYDTVVVIASLAFFDPVAVGDLLADYVDAGGTVVQTVPTFFDPLANGWGLRGRWLGGGYSPFIGTGDWFTFASLGEFDSTHPIMLGVDEAGDSLRQVMELAPGARLVASWTDDEFVATKAGVVALNTFLADGFLWTGDVDLIVHNSILWLQSEEGESVTWLTVTPLTGTISAGESTALQVTIDAGAADLVHGDYAALVRLLSNDPSQRLIDIPVTLHTIGPDLTLGDGGSTWFGRPVQVPVNFTANGFEIAAATFSVDMDDSCLRFDPTDADGDGIPDAIHFSLPTDFQGSASVDLSDMTGELDFFVADVQPPLAALPDGSLATIDFKATCLPTDGPLSVAVNFSTAPTATLSSLNGATVLPATFSGTFAIDPGLPGDCNQDGKVDAGDTISCVLEIFDGDGSFWQDAAGGSFAGSPQGCDSNQDTEINAGDIICTVLIIFQGQGACGQGISAASAGAPVAAKLSLAHGTEVAPGALATVPVQLSTNGNPVAAAAFTLVFDPALLHFDPTDADGDGVPDALTFNVPADFVKSVTLAGPGRIQIVLADLALPLASLPDGVLATLNVTADAAADGRTAEIVFATDATPSLGADTGVSVPVENEDGSVLITAKPSEGDSSRVLLPTIYK